MLGRWKLALREVDMTPGDETASPAGAAGILTRDDGATIAYNRLAGKNPGVVFLHGFKSDMTGEKAKAVESFCRRQGRAFVRYDATGHGKSSGRFEDRTIGQWADDAVTVIDRLTEDPQVLVGSSMGGWLMLLAAMRRPERVAGLLGLAAAPDFTEERIFDLFTHEQRRQLFDEGKVVVEAGNGEPPFAISRRLIEEGRRHLLLHGTIPLTCPIRLIHGQQDPDVPWGTALRLAEHLKSDDVEITLVKSGLHRLSEPADLVRMQDVLDALLKTIESLMIR
jgi:pimeloyl-ACP methyl ester carboxylesterase